MDAGTVLKTAHDWLAKSVPTQVAVVVATTVLLYAPDTVVGGMGLREVRDGYRAWFGVTLLGVGSLLCAEAGAAVMMWTRPRVRGWQFLRLAKRRLHNLTPAERDVLRGYLTDNTRTQYLRLTDGVVMGLEQAKIIYRSAQLGSMLGGFAYNIQPWAWDYLWAHPELVGLAR